MTTAALGWFAPNQQTGYRIRLLPGKPVYVASRVHRIADSPFQCHRELIHNKWLGNCVACDHYNDFWKNGPPRCFRGTQQDFEREVRSIKPVERFFWNIIAREEEDKGPQRWACGKTIQQTILEGILGNPMQNTAALGDVTHPLTGHDFFINRKMTKGIGGDQQYPTYEGSQFLPKSRLGSDEEIERWMDRRWDLQECRKLRPEEDMMAAIEEQFGFLGAPRDKRRVYRRIDEPFIPSW